MKYLTNITKFSYIYITKQYVYSTWVPVEISLPTDIEVTSSALRDKVSMQNIDDNFVFTERDGDALITKFLKPGIWYITLDCKDSACLNKHLGKVYKFFKSIPEVLFSREGRYSEYPNRNLLDYIK